MNTPLDRLLSRVETLIDRIEGVLPQPLGAPDWKASVAYRYRKRSSGHGVLEPVKNMANLQLTDLKEIEQQKEKIQRNTEQFVKGLPQQCIANGCARNRQIFSHQSLPQHLRQARFAFD